MNYRTRLRLSLRRTDRRRCSSWLKEDSHRNGLREFPFEIPAWRVAVVRKPCVDALRGLLGLQLVDGVFRLAAFLVDGEDAKGGHGFKRVAGFRMHHAHANRSKVPSIYERNRQDSRN